MVLRKGVGGVLLGFGCCVSEKYSLGFSNYKPERELWRESCFKVHISVSRLPSKAYALMIGGLLYSIGHFYVEYGCEPRNHVIRQFLNSAVGTGRAASGESEIQA